jgi:hypothetical protein
MANDAQIKGGEEFGFRALFDEGDSRKAEAFRTVPNFFGRGTVSAWRW